MPYQSKQNTNDDLTNFIFAILLVGIILYKFNIPDKIDNFVSTSLNYLLNVKIILISVFSLFVLVYSGYKLKLFISRRINDKNERKNRLRQKEHFINEILERNFDYLNGNEIKERIEELKENMYFCSNYPKFNIYLDDLKIKLKESKLKLIELKDKERISQNREEKQKLKDDIEELENKKFHLKRSMEENEIEILRNLKIDENYVFKKDNLTKQEVKVLLKEKYKQTNQYCVKEKRLITALVKPILNHGLSHIFLVWSVIRLLKTFKGIKDIKVHLTIDADITFKYNNKLFALEIETGTLLSKKKQTEEKVNYLNDKYPNRWLFIVSNKDLIWRYRKLGFSTQRNEVEKNLQILLRNS